MSFFVRICNNPEEDLKRGYSYPMDSFGNEELAHAGLSGYSVDFDGLLNALDQLWHRMGFGGEELYYNEEEDEVEESGNMYLALYDGEEAGKGPDGEDLFTPAKLLMKIESNSITDADDAYERIVKRFPQLRKKSCKGNKMNRYSQIDESKIALAEKKVREITNRLRPVQEFAHDMLDDVWTNHYEIEELDSEFHALEDSLVGKNNEYADEFMENYWYLFEEMNKLEEVISDLDYLFERIKNR